MSVIDVKEGYVLPEITLSEKDLARILPKERSIQPEELIAFADPLLALLEENSKKPVINPSEDIEQTPPEDGDISLKQGFSKPLFIEHSSLFNTARMDAEKIKTLLESEFDVNPARSDLKDKGDVYTAFDTALRNNHFETARLLAATNQFDTHAPSPEKAPLLRIYNALEAEMSSAQPTQLHNIIETLREMVQETHFCYIMDEGSYVPLAMKIKALMSYATSSETYNQLNDLIVTIEHQDPSVNAYIAALDLLHHFPTDKTYDFKLPSGKTIAFEPEGHFAQYTTQLAFDSLTAFLETLTAENSTQAERDVFRTLQEIYRDAVDFKQKMMQGDIINEALDLYNHGDTILLPSGWQGHFINIILNKEMGLYVTANSGERFRGETTSDVDSTSQTVKPIEPAGLLFYHLQDGGKIDFNFIQTTLSNDDRVTLEYNHQHKYGLNKRVYEIELQDQEFNNCAWESHRNAIQGLLFMELMHGGMAQDDAKELATTCFQKWDNFHGSFVIDRYSEQGYGLSVDALVDILKTTANEPNHEGQSEKLMSLLQSEYYQADFNQWVSEHHAIPAATEVAQPEIHPMPIIHFIPEIVPEVMA